MSPRNPCAVNCVQRPFASDIREMNIAVCIKQVADTEAKLDLDSTGKQVLEDGLAWIINPHDESAIEAALQLSNAHKGNVTLIALGPPRVENAIRQGLAMGADRATHLVTDTMPHDPHVVARALVPLLASANFDLVLTGQVAIDGAGQQVPQRLAVELGWPCVTAVEHLVVDGLSVTARRPVDQGEEVYRLSLPAVIGINRRLGEPRYPSFRGIMQAKKKPVEARQVSLSDSSITVERLHLPVTKSSGQIVPFSPETSAHIAELLRQEAKVI